MNPTPNARPRFQFSLVTAFCVITAVAILCFVCRLEGTFPHGAILTGALMAGACWVARRHTSPDLAWSLFAMGWQTALLRVVHDLMRCFSILGDGPPAFELQRDLLIAYVSNLALPFFLSLPAVYLAFTGSRGSRSHGRKWIILCSLVGLVDVTLLTVWLVILIGHTWPWWTAW